MKNYPFCSLKAGKVITIQGAKLKKYNIAIAIKEKLNIFLNHELFFCASTWFWRSSRKAWLLTTTLVILSPFLFPLKWRGKKIRRMNSKNGDQKSCLSARSIFANSQHCNFCCWRGELFRMLISEKFLTRCRQIYFSRYSL